MPISVGEVNASIRFAIASSELDAAKSKLKELADEFNATGGAATISGQRILATMGPLQERIEAIRMDAEKLRIEIAQYETSTGLRAIKQQADQASQSFDQMQMLALRMGERMLMLYALKASFDFVKGIYEAADALVTLSDKTGMSITYLQQLQATGVGTSESTKELGSAIEHLDKNLEEMKGGDALKEIGITFGDIFKMNPDQRFEQVALKIAAIQSPAERARLEIQLFGTDGIDPLIMKIGQLGPALTKMDTAMDETTVRALSDAKRSYSEFGTMLEGLGAKMLDTASKSVALAASPIFVLWKAGIPGLMDAIKNSDMFAASLDHVADSAHKVPPVPPLMGQAFIDSLKVQIPMTKEQTAALDQLRAMGELTYANAVKATAQNQISEAQYKNYEKAVKDAAAAERAHEADIKKSVEAYEHYTKVIDEVLSAGTSWKTTVAGMNAELHEHVKTLLEAGVGEKAIEEWTGATATQTHAVVKELKDEADARALVRRTAEDEAKVLAQLAMIKADYEASDLQKVFANNERKYQDAVATAQKIGIVDAKYYNDLARLRNAENDAAEKNLADRDQNSRSHYVKMLQDAIDYYQALEMDSSNHTTAEIARAKLEVDEKRKLLQNWSRDATALLSAGTNAATVFVSNWQEGLMMMDQGLDASNIKVRGLTGEVESLTDAIKEFNRGNSITYDISTAKGVADLHKMNPKLRDNLSDSDLMALGQQGFTIQDLVAAGFLDFNAGLAEMFGQTDRYTGTPNPAIDAALQKIHAGTASPKTPLVTPTNSPLAPTSAGAGGAQVGMSNTFNVNGTADEVAQKIADKIKQQLMAKVTLTRKFGTAS